MPSQTLEQSIRSLREAIKSNAELEEVFHAYWLRGGGRLEPSQHRAELDLLSAELPKHFEQASDPSDLDVLLANDGELVLLWCSGNAWRGDVRMAPCLKRASQHSQLSQWAAQVGQERLLCGPLLDAIECAPLLGTGAQLGLSTHRQHRARLDILLWEAGARAIELPTFGAWLFSSQAAFRELVSRPARGALRGRVIAARCLEVGLAGMPKNVDAEIAGWTLEVLQPLLLHPEPLVWIHAARALGRLTQHMQKLDGMLLDWTMGNSLVLRQRAITAIASMPAEQLGMLAGQLIALLHDPGETAGVVAALAAATPYLYNERPDIWKRLQERVLSPPFSSIEVRALALGLASLWRRGQFDSTIESHIRRLRDIARRAEGKGLDEQRRWLKVISITDVVDQAERDLLDLERGLDNLMRLAAHYDDAEADARAARFAMSLKDTFSEARRIVLSEAPTRQRAAAMNALESCARAFALQPWSPLLATHPTGEVQALPDLAETWEVVLSAPAEILEIVRQRRESGSLDATDNSLSVVALKLGGYGLDACGDDSARRGPTAYDTCHWLRSLEGLNDGSHDLSADVETALSALFWRLVDTTRGTTLGIGDDVKWLGPFAAWWALVIDRPTVLLKLSNALPMMVRGALERCCDEAAQLRAAVASEQPAGRWGLAARQSLRTLHAEDTELAHGLLELAEALADFEGVAGPNKRLDRLCLQLVRASNRVQGALSDPVRALQPAAMSTEDTDITMSLPPPSEEDDGLMQHPPSSERWEALPLDPSGKSAPRTAALVARAIRLRQPGMLDVWLASLGPVASKLLATAVKSAIRRTPPPPPRQQKKQIKVIAGYELVKAIGEGGVGTIWLVRKPGADRLFVLKIPKADALASATKEEQKGILASFIEEADALAGLYHPNVANIIDRGVVDDMPFLVLEYLIGANLKQYSRARPMTLFELRSVVVESCAGLAALHGAGLVHRDVKPANLWLRLPLAGGEIFDPKKHRDPAATPPLATVVIDFGMVRPTQVPADAAGRFVAGTAGYIAPEQILDPVHLDPRADIYGLAATVYNAATGRAFFDDIRNQRDRIIAHMQKSPFRDKSRLKGFPDAVVKLLRAATARRAAHRPTPSEFAKAFVAAL